MANELKHGTAGTSLSQAEFEGVGLHVFNSQATGDIVYASSSTQLTRLGKATDGDVLTLASGVPSWATPTTGDITGVTAGTGLTGGGTSGTVTVNLALTGLVDTAIANGDYIVFTDATDSNATVKGDLADVATLFAGTGLTASSSVIGVDASQTQITSVGTIGTGTWQGTAIASTYIANDSVTLAKMAGGTDGNIISYDASGNPVAIATGNDGQVLTSAGAGAPPAFEDAGGGGVSLGKALAFSIIF